MKKKLTVRWISELDADHKVLPFIKDLLSRSFPFYPANRSYIHQIPHYRILGYEGDLLVSHLAISHRKIILNDQVYVVFGLSDFCVHPDYSGKGYSTELLTVLSDKAKSNGVDLLLAFTDSMAYYEKHHFLQVKTRCRWLMTENGRSLGLMERTFSKGLMIKALHANFPKQIQYIDLLGTPF